MISLLPLASPSGPAHAAPVPSRALAVNPDMDRVKIDIELIEPLLEQRRRNMV